MSQEPKIGRRTEYGLRYPNGNTEWNTFKSVAGNTIPFGDLTSERQLAHITDQIGAIARQRARVAEIDPDEYLELLQIVSRDITVIEEPDKVFKYGEELSA
jgi:hypothetical protein